MTTLEIVNKLNNKFYNNLPEDLKTSDIFPLSPWMYESDGLYESVLFNGYLIWSSERDHDDVLNLIKNSYTSYFNNMVMHAKPLNILEI